MAMLRRLWPSSLAGRLVVLLVAALALAQIALLVVLRSQRDAMVDGIAHSQALNQTVTFVRLLAAYPPDEGERIAAAFRSRETCAGVTQATPPAGDTSVERGLARILKRMLHGVETGEPGVTIDPDGADEHGCGASARPPAPPAPPDGDDDDENSRPRPPRPHAAAVIMTVPLADGRVATMRSRIEVPGQWNRAATLSFLISSLAVALMAVIVIRLETRSLRTLAAASERFGRGEAVERLPEIGPSEAVAVTRAFNTMQERLSLFLKDRLRLLASISHDLRTPLTTLRLKAEFIEDEAMREDIVATLDELTVICEATLAFTRAEATTEPTATIDLAALIDDVAEEFRLGGGAVAVSGAAPLPYPCRPVALKRALRNLIENAIRYGGHADVTAAPDAGGVRITIDDSGPGLPEGRIEEAFQPFVRIEPSRNAETGGIGLGLAIARSIIRAHGGMLALANRLEGGLRAEISLPRA